MSQPIRPDQVADKKVETFPPQVFDAFNELIGQHFSNGSATVYQNDAVELIWRKLTEQEGVAVRFGVHNKGDLSRRGYLNVEEAYRGAGWRVVYDKPGYNESGHAYFIFSKPECYVR